MIAARLGVCPSEAQTFDEHARAVTAVLEMDVEPRNWPGRPSSNSAWSTSQGLLKLPPPPAR